MSTWPLLRNDVRLQFRFGFYGAYAFVAVAYVAMLRVLPPDVRAVALPPLLLSEVSIIGFFFGGTLLHLERDDGVLQALGVSPMRAVDYLLAKAGSLSVLTGAVALVIAFGGAGTGFDPVLLVVAAALTAGLFVGVGVAAACRFAALDRFFIWGGLASAGLGLPVLPYLGIADSPLWAVVPTYPSLALLAAAFDPDTVPVGARVGSIVALIAWSVPAYALARAWLDRYALGRRGGGA